MPIPDYQTLMKPVLQAAAGGEVRISDVISDLGPQLGLTDDELAEMLPSGRITLFANRVHWAKTYLKQAGLIEQPKRAHYRLTERGCEALSSDATVNNSYLSQFPEFIEFKSRSRSDGSSSASETSAAVIQNAEDTPDELMRRAHSQVTGELREELLDRLREGSPAFFERLLVQLLVEMGFGGSVSAAGRAIGQSGDGGVDGVIDQDELGLDRVYIQAKRYSADNKVGAPAIRYFFGSLDRFKAAKGVFVTTSEFTKDAEETASMLSKRIVLINGTRLGNLLIRHNVGCRVEETLYVKKIDEDFFND
jgi:restriction system protein